LISHILDASAVLAMWLGEPLAEGGDAFFADAAISAVNYAEVLSVAERRRIAAEIPAEAIHGAGIEIIPFDEAQAILAGILMPVTEGFGLSLGDRACLALAVKSEAVAVTADRVWAGLAADGLPQVRVIR